MKEAADIAKLAKLFNTNHPFLKIGHIMEIVIVVLGDDNVSSYDCKKIGNEVMAKMVNLPI